MGAVALAGCAAGQGWSRANTALELGFVAEVGVDAYQTERYILPTCTELNPIVGRCGDRVPLAAYLPVTLVLHAAIAWALPPRMRDMFQAVSIGAEGVAIGVNWSTQQDRIDLAHAPAVVKAR